MPLKMFGWEKTRLRDAAPDLLEALSELVYEAKHLSPRDDSGFRWCRIKEDVLTKASAAIAKAKGDANG